MKEEKQIQIEILQKIIDMLPIIPPNAKKHTYRTGFYQGQKFVNTTIRWKLEEMKTALLKGNN